MRRFICNACGKDIEVNWYTNVRTDENVIGFRQKHVKKGSGCCRGNSTGLSRRRSG